MPFLLASWPGFFRVSKGVCKKHRRLLTTLSQVIDRYNGVTVDLAQVPEFTPQEQFSSVLTECLGQWRLDKRTAAWLKVPIEHSSYIPAAAALGFKFHHAEDNTSLLTLWLKENQPDRTPRFATHQVGVSGIVLHEETEEVLVVQDLKSKFSYWKFPGGLSDLGEDIGITAVREVYEETGVQSEFRSVLAFRQQHNQPGAFGRSDFFFVCRMKALTYDLYPCPEEISKCQWMKLSELNENSNITSITRRITELMLHGASQGFHNIDVSFEEMDSVYKGLRYKLYHRPNPRLDSLKNLSESKL